MKRIAPVAILVTIISLAVCSCTPRADKERLRHAEEVIDTDCDSALMLVRAIDPGRLHGDRDRALYGMLYTQALDRCHEPLPGDSLISEAASYFALSGDKRHCMIANNYKGRTHYVHENYPAAMVAFIRANEIAKELDDKFWIGMTARGIADIYAETYNSAEELAYATEEYKNIRLSGRQPYLNYAMLDLAGAYCHARIYEKAIRLSEQIVDSAMHYSDSYLYSGAKQVIGVCYISDENLDSAHMVFEDLCLKGLAENVDSLYLALANVGRHKLDVALDLISQHWYTDDFLLLLTKYRIFKQLDNYKQALIELEQLDSITIRKYQKRIGQNLTGTIVDYYNLNRFADKTELQNMRIRGWLIIIVSVLIVLMIIAISLHWRSQQRKALDDKILFTEKLQELLNQIRTENSKASSIIRELIASKYELLDELCTIVINCSNQKSAKQRIAEAVTKLIDNLSIHSDKIVELEMQVDTMYNNLFSDFRNDLPMLKDADYRLYLFTILGLSNTAISLFLKECKMSVVYDRKRRLKDKIKSLDPQKRDRYMAFFA